MLGTARRTSLSTSPADTAEYITAPYDSDDYDAVGGRRRRRQARRTDTFFRYCSAGTGSPPNGHCPTPSALIWRRSADAAAPAPASYTSDHAARRTPAVAGGPGGRHPALRAAKGIGSRWRRSGGRSPGADSPARLPPGTAPALSGDA